MKNFNEELQFLLDEFTRVSHIENTFEQMQEYCKLPKVLEGIWMECFNAGIKEIEQLKEDK